MMQMMMMKMMFLAGGRHRATAIDNNIAVSIIPHISGALTARRRRWPAFRQMWAALQPVCQLVLVIKVSRQRFELSWRCGDLVQQLNFIITSESR